MKPETRYPLALGLLVLFLIQTSGTLIESIYILDLMNTSLDAKALGVLFLFSPLFLLALKRWPKRRVAVVAAAALVVMRASTSYLGSSGRLVSAGIAAALGWGLLAWFWGAVRPPDDHAAARGLALGFGLSVLLRTVHFGVDLSLMPYGGWLGVLMGIAWLPALPEPDVRRPVGTSKPPAGAKTAAFGGVLVIALGWFAFAAPAVIARWTDGPYALIVLAVALWCALWGEIAPRVRPYLSREVLIGWNLLFALTLVGTILAHRIPFPAAPTDPPRIVTPPTPLHHLPLLLTLLLMPVLFVDFDRFSRRLADAAVTPRTVAAGMLGGLLLTVILVFVQVFTNVWGYVQPISTPFRNQFWLPYAALALALSAALARVERGSRAETSPRRPQTWLNRAFSLFVLSITVWGLLRAKRPAPPTEAPRTLRVMTYNIQAGNNAFGERDFDAQLELIRQIQPDLLALQESDTTRLSLNNNDLVRYFADQLGYYAYYGPTTVAGTFGTALLSRFPLRNPRVIYTFSDQDEIGTTVAEIALDGQTVTVFNVHPDGSDTAMRVFADTLVTQADGRSPLIVMGDFNLREGDPAYEIIARQWQSAWLSRYPTGISKQGLDMSGRKRIDHIFLDAAWQVIRAEYILPPASHTDHPAHWAEIGLR